MYKLQGQEEALAAEMCLIPQVDVLPQGLKPELLAYRNGTAEAVPSRLWP